MSLLVVFPCPFYYFFFFFFCTVFGCEGQSALKEYTENTQRMQHSYKVPEAYRPHSSRFPKIYHYSCSLREKDVVFKQERLKRCSWSQPIRSQSRCGLKLKRDRAGVVHLMYYRERYAQNWSEICCGIHSFFSINVIVSQGLPAWKPRLTTNWLWVQINTKATEHYLIWSK